jgi:elongation factor Ts
MNLENIKKLRELTGAGIVEVKKALEEASGDEKKAIEILKIKGKEKADKKSERTAQEGVVASYIHLNKKVGAIVKICCETDFVAMNEEFQELARDIAMHVTAMNPKYISPESVPSEIVEKEKKIWKAQMADDKKPEEIRKKIMEGKEKKFREEISLLAQPFVKNPDITISELLSEKIAKTGENIQIGGFSRLEL